MENSYTVTSSPTPVVFSLESIYRSVLAVTPAEPLRSFIVHLVRLLNAGRRSEYRCERGKIKKLPTAARIECGVAGIDGQSEVNQPDVLSTSMDHFVNIFDLVPIITEESSCIQFLFDEGLLHKTTIRCSECDAHLRPNYHTHKRYPFFAS